MSANNTIVQNAETGQIYPQFLNEPVARAYIGCYRQQSFSLTDGQNYIPIPLDVLLSSGMVVDSGGVRIAPTLHTGYYLFCIRSTLSTGSATPVKVIINPIQQRPNIDIAFSSGSVATITSASSPANVETTFIGYMKADPDDRWGMRIQAKCVGGNSEFFRDASYGLPTINAMEVSVVYLG